MIRVLICDDQEFVCEGLKIILSSDPEIQVIGTALDGQEGLDLMEQNTPDLVLMDLKMPVMNGIQATRAIKQKYPHVFVLVLTTYDDDEWLFDAIRSGAVGYLLKDTPRDDLIAAIKGTVRGKSYIDPSVAGKLLNKIEQKTPIEQQPSHILLNEREKEILHLLVRGLTNADIARQVYLSEGTVRNYTSAIFSKLGVSDRTQAVVAALKYGLVDLNSR
ncbi:MAG: response regulator transcription factor [Anaerolineaceae bacterium]